MLSLVRVRYCEDRNGGDPMTVSLMDIHELILTRCTDSWDSTGRSISIIPDPRLSEGRKANLVEGGDLAEGICSPTQPTIF